MSTFALVPHRCLSGLLLLLCAACADFRYYAPRENQNGAGPNGHPAAVYALAADDANARGELRLWSRGASGQHFEDQDGRDVHRVEVHVGFELENTGYVPLELVAIRGEAGRLSLVRTEGEATAGPGQTARLDTWLLATDVASARDLDAFAIRFEVLAQERPILRQVTPFGPWSPPDPRRDDPWFFGPHWSYGVGLGFGLGWHWHCH